MNRYYWILGAFAALVALLAVGLGLNPRDVPSPLVGKPAPTFNLSVLATPEKTMGPKDMRGGPSTRCASSSRRRCRYR